MVATAANRTIAGLIAQVAILRKDLAAALHDCDTLQRRVDDLQYELRMSKAASGEQRTTTNNNIPREEER